MAMPKASLESQQQWRQSSQSSRALHVAPMNTLIRGHQVSSSLLLPRDTGVYVMGHKTIQGS